MNLLSRMRRPLRKAAMRHLLLELDGRKVVIYHSTWDEGKFSHVVRGTGSYMPATDTFGIVIKSDDIESVVEFGVEYIIQNLGPIVTTEMGVTHLTLIEKPRLLDRLAGVFRSSMKGETSR